MGSSSGFYGMSTVKGKHGITGKVEIEMYYKDGHLCIHVVKARNLAVTREADVFVKVYLLFDKGKHFKWKTRLQQNTVNPAFNETFKVNYYYINKLI